MAEKGGKDKRAKEQQQQQQQKWKWFFSLGNCKVMFEF